MLQRQPRTTKGLKELTDLDIEVMQHDELILRLLTVTSDSFHPDGQLNETLRKQLKGWRDLARSFDDAY